MSPTRREFLAASAAALGGALVRPSDARAWGFAPRPRDFIELRRNVGFFTGRGGTIGYLVNGSGVAVVDSQFPESAEECIAGLAERSGVRAVDVLLNTHHHGDHTAGNVAFRGVARSVVAHAQAAEHMRNPPAGQVPENQLFPDVTFDESWTGEVGDERIMSRHWGRAHTGGDAVITFERANVAHMGDLMFHLRHPVVDRAAGATLRGWMDVLETTVDAHDSETVYIFGHAAQGQPVTGGADALLGFRDYLGGLLAFVEAQLAEGRTPDEVLAMREPLPGFEAYGAFGRASARDPLTVAVQEVREGA